VGEPAQTNDLAEKKKKKKISNSKRGPELGVSKRGGGEDVWAKQTAKNLHLTGNAGGMERGRKGNGGTQGGTASEWPPPHPGGRGAFPFDDG